MVNDQQSCESKKKMAFKSYEIKVPLKGWSKPVKNNLSQKLRDRVWFFTISDCNDNVKPFLNKAQYLETELILKNVNDSHFSCEEGNLPRIYGILTLLTAALLTFSLKRYFSLKDRQVYLIINLAIVLDLISEALYYMHYQYYSWDGQGLIVFHILAQLSGFISHFILTGLFILVAQGWTITFDDLYQLEQQVPIAILVFIVQFMVVALNKLTDNYEDKYHQYYGWAGLVSIGIRIGVTIWFVVIKKKLKKSLKDQLGKEFLNRIMMIGLLYFLSFPILVFISETFVVPYYRHRVITIGTIVSQNLAIGILSFVFTNKKSDYQKVSTRNKTIL